MALIVEDRVAETSTSTGTGTFALAGAIAGYRTFASVCATNDIVYYVIEAIDSSGVPTGAFETGLGTYSAANTLTRTTVSRSSNSNAAVSFAAGTKRVILSPTSAYLSVLLTERPRVIPSSAGYTLQNAGTATITDRRFGLEVIGPSAVAIRFVRKNGSPPATPWNAILRSAPVNPTSSANVYTQCAIVRNATTGNMIIFGDYNSGQLLVQAWTSYTAFSANILSPTNYYALPQVPWKRVANDGTNLNFDVSPDGESWETLATTTLAAFIGSVDECGFGVQLNGAAAHSVFQSFEIV